VASEIAGVPLGDWITLVCLGRIAYQDGRENRVNREYPPPDEDAEGPEGYFPDSPDFPDAPSGNEGHRLGLAVALRGRGEQARRRLNHLRDRVGQTL
jgi:hypothetical protein